MARQLLLHSALKNEKLTVANIAVRLSELMRQDTDKTAAVNACTELVKLIKQQ